MIINRLLKRKTTLLGQEGDATFAIDPWVVHYEDLVFGKKIGKGNFGRVFEGTYFGTPVAIKHLFPVGEGLSAEQTRKYVDREIVLLKGLHHPNIVQLIGICEHETGQYIITELVPGGDLKTVLARRDTVISWRQRAIWARDIAYAMNYLHHKGFIHRDLKPDNVLITESGRAKVCDLGFARASKKVSAYMTIAGSDDFMAPEVLLGDKYDEKCDVFGYGAVLANIITRRRPPKRSEEGLYSFKPEQLKPLIPTECPSKLADMLLQCCDYDGTKRPSFDEVLSTLQALLDNELKPDAEGDSDTSKSEGIEVRPTLKMLTRTNNQRSLTYSTPSGSPAQQKLLKMPGMRSMAKDSSLWNQFHSTDSLPNHSRSSSGSFTQSLSTSASAASVDGTSVTPGSGNRERSGSEKSADSDTDRSGGSNMQTAARNRERTSSEKSIDGSEVMSDGSHCGSGSEVDNGGPARRSSKLSQMRLLSSPSDRSEGRTDSERSIDDQRTESDRSVGSERREKGSKRSKKDKRDKKERKKTSSSAVSKQSAPATSTGDDGASAAANDQSNTAKSTEEAQRDKDATGDHKRTLSDDAPTAASGEAKAKAKEGSSKEKETPRKSVAPTAQLSPRVPANKEDAQVEQAQNSPQPSESEKRRSALQHDSKAVPSPRKKRRELKDKEGDDKSAAPTTTTSPTSPSSPPAEKNHPSDITLETKSMHQSSAKLHRHSMSPRVMALVGREEWEGDDLDKDEMDAVFRYPYSADFGPSTIQFFGNLKKGGRVQTLIGLFQEKEGPADQAEEEDKGEATKRNRSMSTATEKDLRARARREARLRGDAENGLARRRKEMKKSSDMLSDSDMGSSGADVSDCQTLKESGDGLEASDAAALKRDREKAETPSGKSRKEEEERSASSSST